MTEQDLVIFLADDDEDDRLIFVEAIEEISPDIKVVEVNDGCKLLQLLSSSKDLPGIIFLDLNMPVKNGKDTLRAIRADKKLEHIPVVLYSTSTNPADIDETFKAGGSLYLEKPYTMCGMVNKLKEIIFADWEIKLNEISRKNYFISSKESKSLHS